MNLNPSEHADASYFNVHYPVPSASLTTGNTSVTTTGGDYWGYAIQTTTATTITIYNSVTALGVIIDIATVTASTRVMNDTPVLARVGISVNLTGTGSKATIFYTPKG